MQPATGLTLPKPPGMNIGGVMSFTPVSTLVANAQEAAARAQEAAGQPVIQSLAGHVRKCWTEAKSARITIERELLDAVHSRRGEYTPEKLARIREQKQPEIYMMIFATKARQYKALMTDVLLGNGAEKPWTLGPTPQPELPQETVQEIMQATYEEVLQAEVSGMPMTQEDVRQRLIDVRAEIENRVMEVARIEAERAEKSVEDVLVEGGFLEAFDQFLDDLTTFKTAFIKGPVVERVYELKWVPGPQGAIPQITPRMKATWKRVDPLNIYPSPRARSVHEGYLIELHNLSRASLSAMIGVEGYNDDAIRAVLDAHGTGGLREWTSIDAERVDIENPGSGVYQATDTIDALQFWGSVSGKMLREWGMDEAEVPDEAREYEVEVWLIGTWVIKAVINPDPLARRPYYADGFSRVPGAFWHNSLYDVIKDCQDMANAAARALAANLGIASGPQVWINVDRVPTNEVLTEMFPWKLWQTTSDPSGSVAPPLGFFQPSSHANELMGVFERFSMLADEYSGIPRYMAGIGGGEGGAGRTASGMSMMITNASKQVKQSVASIDLRITGPLVERCYSWLLQYRPELGLRGDLQVRARGAISLVAKESAQVRLNEFLMATANPIDMQIIGLDGRAELLRNASKRLDINADRVVPTISTIKRRAAQAQMAQMQQAAMQGQLPGNGQELMDGAPVTDNFQPA